MTPTFWLLSLLGCSSEASPTAAIPASPTPTDDTSDTAPPPIPDDSWLELRGELTVADGSPTGGTLTAVVHARHLRTGELSPGCTTVTPLAPPSPVEIPEGSELYGFWNVTIRTTGCPGMPGSLDLGIGPLPPSLYPAAERRGVSTHQTRGLYARESPESPLVVFGLAGTASQRAGTGSPASLTPLPDGDHLLDGIYLLPL